MPILDPTLTQILITLEDGSQVLLDLWDSAVDVSARPAAGTGWLPVGVGEFPGSVELIHVGQP